MLTQTPTFKLIRNNNILEFEYLVNEKNTKKGRIQGETMMNSYECSEECGYGCCSYKTTKLIKIPKYMIYIEKIGYVEIPKIKEEICIWQESGRLSTFSKTYSIPFYDVTNSIPFCRVINFVQLNVSSKIITTAEAKNCIKNHFVKIFLCLFRSPLHQEIYQLILHMFSRMISLEDLLLILE